MSSDRSLLARSITVGGLAVAVLAAVACRAPQQEPAPASAITASASATATAPPPDPREVKARTAVSDLRTQLQSALQGALQQGPPEEAIVVCRDVAPRLAISLSEAAHLRVGRTSHRLRNAGNAPEPWAQPLLDAYASGAATEKSRTLVLLDGSLGYVEPIAVQAACLPCHGDPALMPQAVRDRLAESYPQDAATGFREGDFRGLFWALIPPPA